MKSINFGIDLGTTNSLITKYENGKVTVFKNPIGHKETLASVVAFRPERTLVGDKAREFLAKDPINIFANFKRRMGTDDKFYVVNLDENITPIELSTLVLKELKQFVYSGETVDAAVVTIPASFDTMQSNATKKAGMAAGFKEVQLLQEPIAASLAYFNNQTDGNEKNGYWLVYDLGGGTFDIALMQIKDGEMKVVDHEGNNFLGGADFDFAIIEKIVIPFVQNELGIAEFEEEFNNKFGRYEKLYYELLYKCEEAKKELSYAAQTQIEFDIDGSNQLLNISREQFEDSIAKPIAQTIKMLQSILQRNHLGSNDIEEILLVGGSTYIPYVRQQLAEQCNIKINASIDPTTAVAIGAGFYAANKHYQPSSNAVELGENVDDLLTSLKISSNDFLESELPDTALTLSYSKTSKDIEEVLIVKSMGEWDEKWYRIVRSDGGFDTGLVPLKSKFTEFLPLLNNINNTFYLRVFDQQQNELLSLKETIEITQGQFNIAGQPIPQDICIEVDDKENKTTKLEVIFEKNAILPQKRTIYREISKTIKKGTDDSIIINILEGDRYARPLSNLVVACVEISGKDLNSDLMKGSDIELQISMSDDRQLNTEVYLVMTQQEFKNAFSLSEKQVSIDRLKEQFIDLEKEIRESIKSFSYGSEEQWAAQSNNILEELMQHKIKLFKLSEKDRGDSKYVIAEALSRISRTFDKLGGDDRLEQLRYTYLDWKDRVEQHLPMADFEKEELKKKYDRLMAAEHQILISRNPSTLEKAIDNMYRLYNQVSWNVMSFIIAEFESIRMYNEAEFTNYNGAKSVIAAADKALEQDKQYEFRQHVYHLTNLLKRAVNNRPQSDFKGTGIG